MYSTNDGKIQVSVSKCLFSVFLKGSQLCVWIVMPGGGQDLAAITYHLSILVHFTSVSCRVLHH